MGVILSTTSYGAGAAASGAGGGPGPFTARGVWRGMQAAARFHYGAASLDGLRVAIVGIGSVGMELSRLVHEEGGLLSVADVNQAALQEAETKFGAKTVSPDDIAGEDVDIFSPCALGGAINERTIEQLQARIVAGAANNQLASPQMGQRLVDKGILYAPDYVINGAGVISVGLEIMGVYSPENMNARIDNIGDTLSEIFQRAEKSHAQTNVVADEMTMEIINKARKTT